jgi:hypothetical protein
LSKSMVSTITYRAQPVLQLHSHQPIEHPHCCPSVAGRLWEQRCGSCRGLRLERDLSLIKQRGEHHHLRCSASFPNAVAPACRASQSLSLRSSMTWGTASLIALENVAAMAPESAQSQNALSTFTYVEKPGFPIHSQRPIGYLNPFP